VTAAPGHRPGVDLIEISRVERALLRRPRLADRLFTERELAYAGERARPGRHLAARFAAKEAAIKALGAPLAPRSIEVVNDSSGAPELRLYGAAAEQAERLGVQLEVSLTHSRENAAAVVIASLRPA
jgi:holo-[acyl-carrier protein] synthase